MLSLQVTSLRSSSRMILGTIAMICRRPHCLYSETHHLGNFLTFASSRKWTKQGNSHRSSLPILFDQGLQSISHLMMQQMTMKTMHLTMETSRQRNGCVGKACVRSQQSQNKIELAENKIEPVENLSLIHI